MTHRSPHPHPRARRRGELTRISADASQHSLSHGPLKGRQVGHLTTAVLEEVLDLVRLLLRQTLTESVRSELEADKCAINEERKRRWLAFTS